jgi:hypothetical protein
MGEHQGESERGRVRESERGRVRESERHMHLCIYGQAETRLKRLPRLTLHAYREDGLGNGRDSEFAVGRACAPAARVARGGVGRLRSGRLLVLLRVYRRGRAPQARGRGRGRGGGGVGRRKRKVLQLDRPGHQQRGQRCERGAGLGCGLSCRQRGQGVHGGGNGVGRSGVGVGIGACPAPSGRAAPKNEKCEMRRKMR